MKTLIKITLLLVSLSAIANLHGNTGGERSLSFFNTHTGDSLRVVYYRQGRYDSQAFCTDSIAGG